jgi:phosphate transport system permease protein
VSPTEITGLGGLPEPEIAGLGGLPGPAGPLVATGNLRRRQLINRLATASQTLAALLAVGVLGIVVFSVVKRGAGAISLDFLTTGPTATGGGIAPMIVGTATIVAVATAMAAPVGILIAIFLTEFAGPRAGGLIRLALDLLNGLPSIVIAVFVYGLFVVGTSHFSGFAGSLGLAIVMLPLIARASQEVLLLVPNSLREAAHALGVTRWRMVRGVLLPTALGGILTGTLLAVARAAGETAPLLLVSGVYGNQLTFDIFGQGVPNIPVYIFTASEAADPAGFTRAWGAALVLFVFILVTNIGARALLARSRAGKLQR